jgi:hypothetical protein
MNSTVRVGSHAAAGAASSPALATMVAPSAITLRLILIVSNIVPSLTHY